MAPPNNNNPTPVNIGQDEDDVYTTVIRPKKQYFNRNNIISFSDIHNNKDNNQPSSLWTPSAVQPIPIHGPTSTSTATGNISYPNSRLWSRATLRTINDYATLQEPTTNTNTYNSTSFLTVTPYLSSEKNRDKNDDDEVMSAASASSWGSWGSDYTNLSTSSSSFSRSWSFDSRSHGRRRSGQGQYSTTNTNTNNNGNDNCNNNSNDSNNIDSNNIDNVNNDNDNGNDNGNNNDNDNGNDNGNNNDNDNDNNNGNNNDNDNGNNNANDNNDNENNNNNDNNDNNNNNNFSMYKKKNKYKYREPRDVEIFLKYVREIDPIPVPLSDRYDGGSIRDLDNGSASSTGDLIKDGHDDSNENHWIDANTMVLKDKFPKARFHVLVIPNRAVPTFDDLICAEGVMIVKQLVERAKIIIARESKRSPHLRFKMGFHALPSMTQVHMHVISTDMDSDKTSVISVYNSYTTEAFLTPAQVIRKINYKWRARDFEFLTKKDRRFYEARVYRNFPTCLLCPPTLTGAALSCLQGQEQGQTWPIHNHVDPDMDAELHKAAVEIHDGGDIVTDATTGAGFVPDAIAKNKKNQLSSTAPITTPSIVPTACRQGVWKSTINARRRTFVPWAIRYYDFALLRQHLRGHYLEQERLYCPPSSSPTSSLSSSSPSPDSDHEDRDHDFFHDLNNNQITTSTAQTTYNDNDDDKAGHNEDEDVLSGITVPLLLNHM